MSANLLPKGLRFVEKTDPIRVEITRADPDGPAFVVEVARMSREAFTDLVNRHKLPANVDPKGKTAKKADAKFQDAFCKKAVLGWSGLTVENLKDLFPHVNVEIDADDDGDATAYESGGKEIPYSHDLAVYLYRKAWGDEFAEFIFDAVKNGSEEESEADAALGND